MYQRKDAFHARAKAEGFRSRAAYKLIELARSQRLVRSGDAVLDLGAWPGSWLQVAADLVGPRGLVCGVDLRPIHDVGRDNVFTVVGDVGDASVIEAVSSRAERAFDVVLSDLAPPLSGIRARDEARADELLDHVLTWTDELLRPGGNLVIKLFMGAGFEERRRRLRERFASVRLTRPDATRKGSAEVYAMARSHRPIARS